MNLKKEQRNHVASEAKMKLYPLEIQKRLKGLISNLLVKNEEKIVVASTGRAGSTMLFHAITESLLKNNFGDSFFLTNRWMRRICSGYLDEISDLNKFSPAVCKTHDVYTKPQSVKCKFIFVYGDPLDSALSVERVVKAKGLDWFKSHQSHLRATGDYEMLFQEDVLNYQGQIESWLSRSDENILCIDYDDMWREQERISLFLGFKVDLPERIERQNKQSEKLYINDALFLQMRKRKDDLKSLYCDRIKEV